MILVTNRLHPLAVRIGAMAVSAIHLTQFLEFPNDNGPAVRRHLLKALDVSHS